MKKLALSLCSVTILSVATLCAVAAPSNVNSTIEGIRKSVAAEAEKVCLEVGVDIESKSVQAQMQKMMSLSPGLKEARDCRSFAKILAEEATEDRENVLAALESEDPEMNGEEWYESSVDSMRKAIVTNEERLSAVIYQGLYLGLVSYRASLGK